MKQETAIHSEVVYAGKIITVRRDDVTLENGETGLREVVVHHGGVGILPVDGDGNCYLVRQYRYGAGETLLEMPAGKLELGEDVLACGMRELAEEVGFIASEITSLGMFYPTPAYCSEKIHLFLAQGLTKTEQHLDADEFLEVVKLPLAEAIAMAATGKIRDGKTMIALLRLAQNQVF